MLHCDTNGAIMWHCKNEFAKAATADRVPRSLATRFPNDGQRSL
jgi:hypothetical protein